MLIDESVDIINKHAHVTIRDKAKIARDCTALAWMAEAHDSGRPKP